CWLSLPASSTRVTRPIGMSRGYGEGNLSTFETVPEVTTVSPGRTTSLPDSEPSTRSVGWPASTCTIPLTPLSLTVAPICVVWSVTSVTIEVPGETQVTLPTSPWPLTTAWLTFTPADVPSSIVICVNHRF